MRRINMKWSIRFAAIFVSCLISGANLTLLGSQNPETQWTHFSNKTGGIPSPGPSKVQTASLIIDVDKDGTNDFVIATQEQGPSVYWYRRTVNGWVKYVIESSPFPSKQEGRSSISMEMEIWISSLEAMQQTTKSGGGRTLTRTMILTYLGCAVRLRTPV